MELTTTAKNLHELIRETARMSLTAVAELMPVSYWRLYEGPLARGLATPIEIDKLAEVLRLPREQVEAAVRESARRHEAIKTAGADARTVKAPGGDAA